MNNWTDLVVSLAVAAIPIIGAWVSKEILKNKKATAAVNALAPLAHSAVVAAEKLGASKSLTGADKKNNAISDVVDGLTSLGFTKANIITVENAVEAAFLNAKDEIESAYPRAEEKTDDSTSAPASPLPADIGDKLDTIVGMLKQPSTTATGDSAQVPADDSAKTVQAQAAHEQGVSQAVTAYLQEHPEALLDAAAKVTSQGGESTDDGSQTQEATQTTQSQAN